MEGVSNGLIQFKSARKFLLALLAKITGVLVLVKMFAPALMLGFSLKCDRLLKISLILLSSHFLCIND